jgi:hypothetical protein
MNWTEIAEAAEKASGPDLDLVTAAVGGPGATWDIGCGDDGSDELSITDAAGEEVWSGYRHLAPDSSVDACLRLIEALPAIPAFPVGSPPSSGWKIGLYRGMTPAGQRFGHWEGMVRPHGKDNSATAATPALALLAAYARAKAATPPDHSPGMAESDDA